ncbi:response regulator transcription factor [Inquilinus sp. OTU3971]|uniref:response regulator transcription factor n=1 Tax=Inquilinus sp. OTU3971 TaxID=3043855 RepID=UPI00313CD5AC
MSIPESEIVAAEEERANPGRVHETDTSTIPEGPASLSAASAEVPAPRQRIAIIDPRSLTGEVLKLALHAEGDEFRGEAYADVRAWRNDARGTSGTAAILLVIGTADAADPGLAEDLQNLSHDFPEIPMIVVGEIETSSQVARIIEYGARGYIPTSVGLPVAIGAISLVRAGGVFVPASMLLASRREAGKASPDAGSVQQLLTERQAAIAAALSRGKANKIIAYELNLSESTVKVHVRNIMKKLQARNRTEVAYKLHGSRFPAAVLF